MPLTIDLREIKAEARALLQSGSVPPLRFTLLFLALNLVLSVAGSAVDYMLGDWMSGLTAKSMPYLFVSILISLLGTVLLAGYTRYCLGVARGEAMPYESLFSAFPYAGRVILLAVAQGLLIGLGFTLMIVPGVVLTFAYAFALYHLCDDPGVGAIEALRRSRVELRGYKGQLFLLLLSFLPLLFLLALPLSVCEYFLSRTLPNTLPGELLHALIFGLLSACAALYPTPYIALAQVGFYRRLTEVQTPEDGLEPLDK